MRRKKKETQDDGLFSAAEQGSDPGTSTSRLMPADIQQREFRLGFRGYREAEVDEFLDAVTEEVARLHEESARLREENRRLREGAMYPTTPFGGGADLADAGRQAEQLLDEARERADRIVREAEARARTAPETVPGGGEPSGHPGVLSPFLGREREFLQGLASLIGQHAEFVKVTARSVRRGVAERAAPAEVAGTAERAGDAGGEEEARPQRAANATPPGEAEEAGPDEEPAVGDREAPEEGRADEAAEAEAPSEDPNETGRGGPVAGGPERPPSVSHPTPSRPVEPADLSPWRGVQTAPARRDTAGEPTQAWESPFTEEASSLEEPGAVSSSIEGGREKREDDRSLRELFWGEE